MDLAAILISGINTAGAATMALIQRGAGAAVEDLKKRVAEAETKLKALEGLPAEWARARAELATFVNDQIALAKREIERAKRQPTGSQPVLPTVDDLRRDVGMPDAERRIQALEDQRAEDQRAALALQRQLGTIDAMLKMLSEGHKP